MKRNRRTVDFILLKVFYRYSTLDQTQLEILKRDRVPLIPSCLVGPPIAAAMKGLAGGREREEGMKGGRDE